jgi:hypothetical protein
MRKRHFISLEEQDNNQVQDFNNVNDKNSQEYQNIIEHSKQNTDDYWDINNPIIKIILFILFLIIVLGVTYYLLLWFS